MSGRVCCAAFIDIFFVRDGQMSQYEQNMMQYSAKLPNRYNVSGVTYWLVNTLQLI